MKISDFRKAMRPKKYLTRDFVVYQDPKMQAARSEMQAGGVVEREGFSVGQGARTDLGEKGVKELPSNMKRIFDIVYPEKNWEDLSSRQRGNFIYDFPRREKILNSIPKNYITLDELAEKLNIKRTSINEPRTTLGKFINQNLQPQTFGSITGKGGGFTKYYKDPGVRLTKQILRIAGQDVRIDNLRKNTVRNINKLYTTYYDDFYKKGLVPNIEDIKIMSASEAGNATTRLAQILDGKKFKNKGLEKIRVNKKVANRLFEELSKFQFGNPYQSQLYKISLETIDQKLGNKKGTFNDLKKKAKNILKENKIAVYDVKSKNPYGFNINEIAGVTGSAKSKAPEFSQFIDIMEGELNQKDLAAFQSVLSRARGDIELNPNALQKQMRKVNSYASNLEKKFDVQLPRIRKAEDITKYYTPKRLEELKKQGLDIVSASKRAGYTIQMPKGAVTAQEFVKDKKIQKNLFKNLDVDPETREILNRLNNKLSMNPFDAEGLFKSEISKLKKIGTPAAKVIGGVLGGLIVELGFEAAFAIPAYSRGEDFDEILGKTLFGLAGAGKTRLEKVVEESGFDPDVVKYVDLLNTKEQFQKDVGTLEYFGKPGGDTGYGQIFSPGEKSPLEKRLVENAQILDKELDQLKEGSPLEQKFKQAEDKLEKRYAEKVEGSTPRKFLKETGESVIDYFKDEEERFNRRMEEIERLGFKRGGFGKIGRRSFLKLAAGIAAIIGGIRGGVKQLKTPVAKKVLKDAPEGTPDWFAPLVEKITKEGIDVPGVNVKTTTTRETVKKLEVPNPESDGALTDKYFLYENPDTGEIRIEIDAPGLGANDGEFSLYFRPDRIDGITDDGIPIRSDGEFFVTEDRVVGRATSPDDYDIDLEPFDTDLEGSASNWHKVEEFATGKTDKKAQAKQLEKKERIEAFPHEDLTDRYGDYDPPDPDDY